MFSKPSGKDPKPGSLQSAPPKAVPSLIGAGTKVSGDIRSEGELTIDGTVDGDIQCATAAIGKSAEINGEIMADTIRVWGRVNGRIRGRDVVLYDSAQISGDVLHETLEIARGAKVEGMLKRDTRDEPKRPPVNLVMTEGDGQQAAAAGKR